jgi:hypothetical protein
VDAKSIAVRYHSCLQLIGCNWHDQTNDPETDVIKSEVDKQQQQSMKAKWKTEGAQFQKCLRDN